MLALIGPSGCGKTTLLRTLNRLTELTPTARRDGTIALDGRDIDTLEVTELRRRVAMVFQQPNPFPMSIFDNVAYALREQAMKRPRKAALEPLVVDALQRAGLYDEVRDDLDRPGAAPLRRPAAAPVHRPRDRDAPRGAADGRAVLGAGPALDDGHRGAHRRSAPRAGDRDRHPQPAAGLPCRRPRRLHVPRRPRRVRPHPSRSSAPRAPSARATTSGVPSGDPPLPRRCCAAALALSACQTTQELSAQRAKAGQEARQPEGAHGRPREPGRRGRRHRASLQDKNGIAAVVELRNTGPRRRPAFPSRSP